MPYATSINHFRGRKKKVGFIIPSVFFRKEPTANASTKIIEPALVVAKKIEVLHKGLTISSIEAIKNFQNNKQKELEKNLPQKPFSEEQLKTVWEQYIQILKVQGHKSLSSLLSMGEPILNSGETILIRVASENQKREILSAQNDLLSYIRNSLENFQASLDIVIDPIEVSKTTVMDFEDLYKKLCDINPNIEKLIKTFDVDMRG